MERMRTFAPQTRLRKEPGVSAEILATISANTEVEVLAKEGRFYKTVVCTADGTQAEGYIAENFLKPLEPEGDTDVTTQADARLSIPKPKFDQTTGWLAAGLILLLVTNTIGGIAIWVKMHQLANRPVYASCSGHSGISSYQLRPLQWVTDQRDELAEIGSVPGKAEVTLEFSLSEKEARSEIVVFYRPSGTGEAWQEAKAQRIFALDYKAKLLLDYGYDWEYRVAEKLGEVVRMGELGSMMLVDRVGTGYVQVEVMNIYNSSYKALGLRFSQHPIPLLADRQIKLIKLDFSAKGKVAYSTVITQPTNLGERQAYEFSGQRDKTWDQVTITVTFKDGQERSKIYTMAELDSNRWQEGIPR